jgi:hypothetical protein
MGLWDFSSPKVLLNIGRDYDVRARYVDKEVCPIKDLGS